MAVRYVYRRPPPVHRPPWIVFGIPAVTIVIPSVVAVTLVTIFSGEPIPRIPAIEDPEQDKFNRDVVSYLRRLSGRFEG